MKDIICPSCGKQFQVDDAVYDSILSQVKNKEFEAELKRRMEEEHRRLEAEQKASEAIAKSQQQEVITKHSTELAKKDAEIIQLKERLNNSEKEKKSEIALALTAKENDIAALKAKIEQGENEKQIAVMQEQNKAIKMIQEKDSEIEKLRSEVLLDKKEAELSEKSLKERYENQIKQNCEQYEVRLKDKEDEILRLRDYKARLSTKMIGESLEIHCSTQFNLNMRSMMPRAYFEKDNDASGGSNRDLDSSGKRLIIALCHCLSGNNLLIQHIQLRQQHRSLDGIQAGVQADPHIVVLSLRSLAMDLEGVQQSGNLIVIRKDRTAVAVAAEGL